MSIQIDDSLIDHISQLSKLELTKEEKEKSKAEMSKLCEFFDQLRELDVLEINTKELLSSKEDISSKVPMSTKELLVSNELMLREDDIVVCDFKIKKKSYEVPITV